MTDRKATNEDLKLALNVAVAMLSLHEPPDSRACSNEFVSLSAVSCDLVNDEAIEILKAKQERIRECGWV